MKIKIIAIIVATVFLSLFIVSISHAQLIITDEVFRVVKVDKDKYRIEITKPEKDPNRTIGYVYCDGDVKCYKNGERYNWEDIGKGSIIRVKGGVRMDTQINAKQIWVVKNK